MDWIIFCVNTPHGDIKDSTQKGGKRKKKKIIDYWEEAGGYQSDLNKTAMESDFNW